MKNSRVKLAVGLTATLALAGCGGSSSGGSAAPASQVKTDYAAVIQTVNGGYTSSAIELVDLEESNWTAVPGYYPENGSDYSVWGFKENFYQVGQYNLDSLLKVSIKNPSVPVWQYSTKDNGAATANPIQVVFKDESTGYLIQHAASKVWKLNLDATSAGTLRTQALDLSSYGGGSIGSPNAKAGVIVGNRLYVAMQRLTEATYAPGDAYIAVFNIDTGAEIDLDIDAQLKGIPLISKNPNAMQYVEGVGLVVYSVGRYYPQEFTGGIEVVDINNYSTRLLVDDGNSYGQITNGVAVSATVGYFIAYASYQHTSIYRFNPSTGAVSATPLPGLSDLDIGIIAKDPKGRVWIGISNASAPHVVVIDSADDHVIDDIALTLNPVSIAFTAEQ